MDAAASSRAVLCERLPDGTTLLVMPGPAGPDQAPLAEVITPADVIPAVRRPAA
jgi:hypothetical protein